MPTKKKLPSTGQRTAVERKGIGSAGAAGYRSKHNGWDTPYGQALKRTLAKTWAEMEAGKISVHFQEDNPDRCLLCTSSGMFLLELVPKNEPGRTFEFKPEHYKAPTDADIERMMKSAR
ncbi:hypothetical protein ACH79_16390 [Bradyrhizobium sp. CCBAU 051011]|uniref:hypothetical protein n=1 Tax=Bradyrhizobium sp. CCBAU 051011 TaxID=858422 RepID=UPI001374191E|nr:hypothetical protein [Bradyrhizobium sp. CCBAU 051011]QHO73975.1 hypothetical protein ACH79_16390 [Bradyrhizobium sp. CCBAU 051011]